MRIPVADKTETKEFVTIPDQLVNQPINSRFIAQVIRGLLANRRQGTAHSKTRGEVRGGGRKPWRQKGTGRARQGSIRSPQWVGGGIVFGPRKNRHHHQALSRAVLQKATRLFITDRIKYKAVTIVSAGPNKVNQTKPIVSWLESLKIPEGAILIVTEKYEPNLLLGSRNIPGVECIDVNQLNAYDVASHSHLVIERDALVKLLPNVSIKTEA